MSNESNELDSDSDSRRWNSFPGVFGPARGVKRGMAGSDWLRRIFNNKILSKVISDCVCVRILNGCGQGQGSGSG